jgi:hypothetical protein
MVILYITQRVTNTVFKLAQKELATIMQCERRHRDGNCFGSVTSNVLHRHAFGDIWTVHAQTNNSEQGRGLRRLLVGDKSLQCVIDINFSSCEFRARITVLIYSTVVMARHLKIIVFGLEGRAKNLHTPQNRMRMVAIGYHNWAISGTRVSRYPERVQKVKFTGFSANRLSFNRSDSVRVWMV